MGDTLNSGRHLTHMYGNHPRSKFRRENRGGVTQFFRIFHIIRLYQCNPYHPSPSLTASLLRLVPTRSSFFEISKPQKSKHARLGKPKARTVVVRVSRSH